MAKNVPVSPEEHIVDCAQKTYVVKGIMLKLNVVS